MRGAFVIRLGAETTPSEDRFEGWVEEVDSGEELRFHSTSELVKFLGEHFCAAFQSQKQEAGQGSKLDICEEGES
jgi:hypothetical protein